MQAGKTGIYTYWPKQVFVRWRIISCLLNL